MEPEFLLVYLTKLLVREIREFETWIEGRETAKPRFGDSKLGFDSSKPGFDAAKPRNPELETRNLDSGLRNLDLEPQNRETWI